MPFCQTMRPPIFPGCSTRPIWRASRPTGRARRPWERSATARRCWRAWGVCAEGGPGLMVHYHQYNGHPAPFTYDCTRLRGNYGGPLCQHVGGPCLDAFVSEQVLAALEPAALELSLAAAEQVEQERAAL